MSPEVLSIAAGIIPGPRSSTDHCQFEGPFLDLALIGQGFLANPLCSRVDGGTHLDSRYQGGVIIRTVVPHTVDEKGRRAIHAAAYAADKIVAHFISVLTGLKNIPHGCFGKVADRGLRIFTVRRFA